MKSQRHPVKHQNGLHLRRPIIAGSLRLSDISTGASTALLYRLPMSPVDRHAANETKAHSIQARLMTPFYLGSFL